MSKRAGLDMCIDGNYWGHQGWGEANSGLTFKITNNIGVNKGGKIVMVTDVDCV